MKNNLCTPIQKKNNARFIKITNLHMQLIMKATNVIVYYNR